VGVSVGTNGVSVFEHRDNHMPALLVYDAPILGWTHIAVVYTNRRPTLFVNGNPVRTGLMSLHQSYPCTWLGEAGAISRHYGPYKGLLDEVAIYNRALSVAEVAAIHEAQEFGKCALGLPTIVRQPAGVTVQAGGTASFTVEATGQQPLSYQWLFNGTPVANATNRALVLTHLSLAQTGTYSVSVSNAVGTALSAGALLTILPEPQVPPAISSPPLSRTVNVGANVTFYVAATGTMPLTYQWALNGIPIQGATTTSLVLTNVQLAQAGTITISITNAYGWAQSSALLNVSASPPMIRIADVSGHAGGTVTVPITLTAAGRENAIGFTVNYTALRMLPIGVSSVGLTNLSLVVNTNSLGRIGVLISAPFGETFPAGTSQVLQMLFTSPASSSTTFTALSFGDDPVSRQVSDPLGNAIQAVFIGGTVTLLPSEYEADVAPRPNGDGTTSVTDWVTVGRFAARLDSPSSASEFRRADCAPRSTLGDGNIGLTDWVQAGRYAVRLDPSTYAGGPDKATGYLRASAPRKMGLTRQIRVSDAALAEGDVQLTVHLESDGRENAVAFSFAFDPAALSFTEAKPGSGLPAGTLLQVNTAQAGPGSGGALARSLGKPSAKARVSCWF